MKISVSVAGLDTVRAQLRGLSDKKIKVAAVAAINSAAYKAAEATKAEMQRVFERPTPWVLGGVRYNKATKDTLEAKIDFDKWGNKTNVTVEKVLQAEIMSGQRRHKRHEIALQRVGILPPGMAIVPGGAAEIDQYGNMKGSQIVQIIAWFRAAGEQGYKSNMNDKGRARLGRDNKKTGAYGFQYFAIQKATGKLMPGIYKRIKTGFGSAIKPVMVFVRMPSYKRRLDFYGVAERAALEEFQRFYPRYLEQLLQERGL